MGKGHRDNHAARKNRGPEAFNKKKDRRAKKGFKGSWWVTFACAKAEYIPLASSSDIKEIAIRQHKCVETCTIVKFEKVE